MNWLWWFLAGCNAGILFCMAVETWFTHHPPKQTHATCCLCDKPVELGIMVTFAMDQGNAQYHPDCFKLTGHYRQLKAWVDES